MCRRAFSYRLLQFGTAPVAVEHEVPEPGPGEVLLQVTHAGVCHSDVYIMDGYQDLGDGHRMEFSDSAMPMPLTMGHEVVGKVYAVGNDVDPSLVGQRRLIYPWIGCGHCVSCLNGQENHCEQARTLGIFRDGGYGDFVLVPDQRYLVDISGLDPAWASTLACSGLTVFSALNQLRPVKPDSHLAIIGLGGLGLMAVSVAKALGVDRIIACDISEDRLGMARQLGATAMLNTQKIDAARHLRELAGGSLYGVLDTVGLPSTFELAVEACMKGGKVVLIGLQGGRVSLPLPTLPFKALSVIGTYTGTLDELKSLVDLAKSKPIKEMPVVNRPMRCLPETLEDLRNGKILGRVVLNPLGGA